MSPFDLPQIAPLRKRARPLLTRGIVAWRRVRTARPGAGRFARGKALLSAYGPRRALRALPQFIAYFRLKESARPRCRSSGAPIFNGPCPLLTWTVRSTEERQRAAAVGPTRLIFSRVSGLRIAIHLNESVRPRSIETSISMELAAKTSKKTESTLRVANALFFGDVRSVPPWDRPAPIRCRRRGAPCLKPANRPQ